MALRVEPLTAHIGAEVSGVDLRRPLEAPTAAALREALRSHLVLFLRDQDLTDEEHLRFASTFGPPNVYPVTAARGLDESLEWIEDGPDSPAKADLWHTDAAFLPEPPDVAVLNMRVCPPVGGDTLWLSLYAALEGLSPAMQAVLESLELDVHPGPTFKESVELQFGPGIYEEVATQFAARRVPLVRVHPETERRALFLCGAYVRGIAGMRPAESDAILGVLRSRLDDPNIQCRWHWRTHDVAVWDERCTNHRALGDHYPQRRVVRRCTVGGSAPVGPAGPAGPFGSSGHEGRVHPLTGA